MAAMTGNLSPEQTHARERARVQGRFGTQERTSPEPLAGRTAAFAEWDRQVTLAEERLAEVAAIASRDARDAIVSYFPNATHATFGINFDTSDGAASIYLSTVDDEPVGEDDDAADEAVVDAVRGHGYSLRRIEQMPGTSIDDDGEGFRFDLTAVDTRPVTDADRA